MKEPAAPTFRLGLIGDPVAHSLSPAIQQAALDALGIHARYELWPTPLAEVTVRVASLRKPGVLGANVTVPHKLAVMALLDEVSPLARQAGAVNTIVHRDDCLSGDNTDVHGFAAALREVLPDAAGRPALILGAGGAARAVVLALNEIGVTDVVIANRDAERARKLTTDLLPIALRVVAYDDAVLSRETERCGLLINATSVGWRRGESPLPLALLTSLAPSTLVVDLTYRETDLLEAARRRGLTVLDGLSMLVHQGARALELWTGRDAPLEIMRRAAEQARDTRGDAA